MAIEYCEIYILDYGNLRKYAQINEEIMQNLTEIANKRMEVTLRAEELYKKQLNEKIKIARKSFGEDTDSVDNALSDDDV